MMFVKSLNIFFDSAGKQTAAGNTDSGRDPVIFIR